MRFYFYGLISGLFIFVAGCSQFVNEMPTNDLRKDAHEVTTQDVGTDKVSADTQSDNIPGDLVKNEDINQLDKVTFTDDGDIDNGRDVPDVTGEDITSDVTDVIGEDIITKECSSKADCASLEDKNLCNGTLICDASHKCVVDPTTIVKCDNSKDTDCKKNQCNPDDGKCVLTIVNIGDECDDKNACTQHDTCKSDGSCQGISLNCNDDNQCTNDSCDISTGHCNHTPVNCDDNNQCTDDSCDKSTGFCSSTLINCNDDDPCTIDSCDKSTGCIHTDVNCDDDNKLTLDYCVAGSKCLLNPDPSSAPTPKERISKYTCCHASKS